MALHTITGSRKGTTIVEILVVMVVLLVGILTVVQMFPTGFRVVRMGESQTIASKLAEQELERWKNMASNLPVGILPIDDSGTVINGQYCGPNFFSFLEPDGFDPDNPAWDRGNVLNIRQIYGESTAIPVPTYFQTGVGQVYGCRYTLAFSPIDVYPGSAGDYIGLVIKSGELRRRRGNTEFWPPYLRPGQYAVSIDSDGGSQFSVAFPAYNSNNPDALAPVYYISYSYWAEDGAGSLQLMSVIDQPIDLSQGGQESRYDGGWVTVSVPDPPAGFAGIEPDTDSCARGFRPLPTGKDWDDFANDPYYYYLADSVLGVVAFSPIAYGKYEYTSTGRKPIEARIDYRLYDPRIIREDRVAPQPRERDGQQVIPVKLSLRFVLNAGSPTDLSDGDVTDNPDEPTFEGLMRGINDGGVQKPKLGVPLSEGASLMIDTSILIIDLSTGLRVDLANVEIDHNAGVVYLPPQADLIGWITDSSGQSAITVDDVKLSGRHLRFFYRADGDWSIQCQKAYATYLRDWRTAGDPDYYHYQLNGSRLTFAACEGSKTVSVDYTYSRSGQQHKVAGESHRISDSAPYGFELDVPADATVDTIHAVVGTSFRARVIWRDGSRWRHVDMDTNLIRDRQ